MKKFAFVTALAVGAVFVVAASAQVNRGAGQKIQPIGQFAPTGSERTPEQMDAFAASHPVVESPNVRFRPTMGDAAYRSLKAMADAQPKMARPNLQSPVPLHGVTGATKFVGGDATGNASVGEPGWFPPDTEGAIGATQFVQTANNYINVYTKGGALLSHRSLTSFMGSSTSTFDSRVSWDALWGRWVVASDSFPVDSTHQNYYMAFSKTASATGPWFVYVINTNGFTGTGSFWDFPSMGLQQDSIIFTANVFGTSSFLGAFTYAVPKAQAYNGQGWSSHVFGGLAATLQPPNVLKGDSTGFAWMAAADGSAHISMYAFENPSSFNNQNLLGPYSVAGVPAYSAPASAVQPAPCGGGANALDTSDSRFVNASTEYGDLLYQVHSVSFGTANPRYYVISGLNTFVPTVAETGIFWTTGSSSDWNASIAADSADNLVITWSSVDSGYNAEVRYVGRQHGDPAISGATGSTLIGSGACLTGNFDANFGLQRWGDYSAVTPDPSTAKTFWIINEDIISAGTWGNEIGKVHF